MKKYLTLLLFIAIQISSAWSKAPAADENMEHFVGCYKRVQGTTVFLLNVYIENGKLLSKQLWDLEILPLQQKSGDSFTVKIQQNNWPVKFIRDTNKKIKQMQVAEHDLWIKVDDKPLNTEAMPTNPSEYLGRYKASANQKDMVIELAIKNGKIWGTQLWDGGKSPLTYLSNDNFLVNALDIPVIFKRGSNNKVTQLVLNNKTAFTKVD